MVSAAGNRIGSVYIHLGVTSDMATFRRAGDEAARVSNRMRNTIVAGNRQIADSFTRAGQAVAVMHGPLGGVASRLQAIGQLSRGASMGMASLAAGMAASTFGMAKFVQTGDKMQRMANNLRTVTTGAANLAEVQQELFDISQRSRVAMEGTVTLYARTARATEHLGLSQQKLLRIVETVQKSFAVGGATTAEAMGAAIQLSQGIASDRFSGEEFRSVSENAPVLLREMAKQLGVNIGKLREMAHAGELTGKVVTEAIYGASEAIDKDFGKTISTVEQSMARLWNAVDQYIYGVDQSYGVTSTLASGVNALADSFEDLMWWVESAAIGLAAFAGGRIGGAALKVGKGYLGDVAVHGFFARTRMQTKAELDEITKSLRDIDKARKEIETQIRDQEQRFVERASRSNNAVAMIRAAHQQEMDGNERLAALEKQRIDLRDRQIVQQNSIVAGLRQERQEALRTVRSHGARVTNAGRRYAQSESKGDLRAMEREQARLVRAQESYRRSVERLAAAEGGVFDRAAIRAYGNELNNIQKQLNANLIAQHKTQQDINKAQRAYIDAQKRSPEEAKKFKAVADQHRVTMAGLVTQQKELAGSYQELIRRQDQLNSRVSLMGAAWARATGFVGGMFSLLGGGPGIAIMGLIAGFASIGTSLHNSTRRTEEFRQKLIELDIAAEDVEKKIGGTADKTLAGLLEWQKEIDAQIAKLQGEGGVIDRLFGDGNTSGAVIDAVERRLFVLRDNLSAIERQGRDAEKTLADIADTEAFLAIANEVKAAQGDVARLDERLDAIVAKNPEFSEFAVTLRAVAQRLREAATAAGQVANDIALAGNATPAWIEDQMWQAEQFSFMERRREAMEAFLQERVALAELSKEQERHKKIRESLAEEYTKWASENKEIADGIENIDVYLDEMTRSIIAAEDATELFNAAQQRAKNRVDELVGSLIEDALDGKISLDRMKASMEAIAEMNPDASSWIRDMIKVAEEAWHRLNKLRDVMWETSQSRPATIDGFVNLPDSVDVVPTRRVDPYFEAWDDTDKNREAYEKLIETAQRRVEQMKEEIDLVGRAGIEADALRFQYDLMRRAKESGHPVGEKELEQIKALTAAYKQYAEALTAAEAMNDILFERSLIGLSDGDQEILTTLRQLGIEADSSYGRMISGGLRTNQVMQEMQDEMEELKDIGKDAFMGILDLLYETGDIGEKLIGIFAGIGKQFAQMGMERLWKSISGQGASIFDSSAPRSSTAMTMIQSAQVGREIGNAIAPSITSSLNDNLTSFAAAIRKIESGSYAGNYSAIGPVVTSGAYAGDRAYGAYQVMGKNIASWTKEVLGHSLTISEFLADRAAQDKVFFAKFGQSLDKFGNFADATSVWFSGRPLNRAGNSSDGYNTVPQYVQKANDALANYPGGLKGGVSDGVVDANRRLQMQGYREEMSGQGPLGHLQQNNLGNLFGTGLAAIGAFAGGYQSGSPLMGALSGAMTGFGAAPALSAMGMGAAAGPIGIIGGAIIGLIGGIFGKSKKKKEAKQELEKNRGAITSLLAIGEGTGIGEMTQLWRDYYDEVQKVTELAWKAGDMDLVKRVQSAFNQFFDRLYEDYQRSFDGMVESLRMGHGTSSPFVQAANEVTELRESLINLIADAEEMNRKHLELVGAAEDDWKVGRMADQIREMTEAAVDMARSFLLGAKELSAMESEVMRVDGAASALQITLEQLGKSAEEAAAIIEADTIQALDKLRRTFLSDVSLSMADLADMGFVAELVSAHDMYAMRLRDFAALGLDASLATQELNLRLAQIASQADLTDDHLRMLAGAFPQLSDGLLALIGGAGGNTSLALDNAKSALDQAKADLRSAYEDEMRLLEQVVSRHEALIKSLQRFRDDLRLDSNLSPLDPYQRLQEAQKQFQETAALALTGDEDALGRLEDVSRAYLTEAKAYYATSETYFRIFGEVEGILDQALAVAGNQLSEAEQQLAALKDLVSPLIDINDSVLTVADAINNLALAQAAADQAEAAHKASQDALLQQILGQLAASGATGFDPTISRLYQETVGRTPDAAGHAFWLNHLDQGYTADQIRQLMMQSPEYTALQGFSAGGFTGLGDLNQVMGVVHGREFVAHAEATRRWRPQLEMMNAGRDPFTSGNPVLVAELREEIRALRDEMRQNTQATVAGAQGQIAATEGTTNAVNRQIEGQWRKSRTRAA